MFLMSSCFFDFLVGEIIFRMIKYVEGEEGQASPFPYYIVINYFFLNIDLEFYVSVSNNPWKDFCTECQVD